MATGVSGVVQGMNVNVPVATSDPTSVHVYLKITVTDPNSNVTFYTHEAEYDRNVAGGETVPQFVARIVSIEKPLRDAAILSHLSRTGAVIDVTAQAIALVQP